MQGVAALHRLRRTRVFQVLLGVLTYGFEEAIPRAIVCFVGHDERTAHQRGEVLDHVELADAAVVPDDWFGIGEGGATGEHRETIEHESLVVAQ
jgi:hypothetical protein